MAESRGPCALRDRRLLTPRPPGQHIDPPSAGYETERKPLLEFPDPNATLRSRQTDIPEFETVFLGPLGQGDADRRGSARTSRSIHLYRPRATAQARRMLALVRKEKNDEGHEHKRYS